MPTPTPSSMAGSTSGTRTPSERPHHGSGASTPANKMFNSPHAGRTVSMSRLDSLSKPRVVVIPHATATAAQPAQKRQAVKKSGLPPNGTVVKHPASKSVSLVQLNCPSPDKSQAHMTRSVTISHRSVLNRSGKSDTSLVVGYRCRCYFVVVVVCLNLSTWMVKGSCHMK